MNNQKLLDPVWTSYQTTIDCLKIADRGVTLGELRLLANTRFIRSEPVEAKQFISQSKDDAGDFVILSLWAVFERRLVESLQSESQRMLRIPATLLNNRLHGKIMSDMEYWKSADILDLFKTDVNEELIMQAKQIKRYRDWIAHKNPRKPDPPKVIPQTAYKILSLIIDEIEGNLDFVSGS